MSRQTPDWAELEAALKALRQEIATLSQRVAALETRDATPPVPLPAAPRSAQGPSEELLAVISATLAAYLGVRPHIRQVRLLGSAAWSQQGRVTVQASHALQAWH